MAGAGSRDYPFFFTWSAQSQVGEPLHLAGGEGSWFFTAEGDRWLDMGALIYQVNLGHGHPRMIAALKRQADQLAVTLPNAVFPAKVELAERLLALAPPGFTKVFFTLGGAEANENALKMARLVTGRYKLLSRYRSYHGASMGALSLSGDWRRPPLEPALPGVVHALDCYCARCPFGKEEGRCGLECADHIGHLLDLEGPRTVAAVFLEPIPGGNGVLVPPPGYWARVREACDRHGTLLVADEVLCGFGRTGRWLGIDHEDVVPDMITLAKGLTGGYATLGAVLVHERVARYFEDHVLVAGLTGYAHPVSCAVALEALKVYEEEGLVRHAAELEAPFLEGMRALAGRHPDLVVSVRGRGLLGALELSVDEAGMKALQASLSRQRVYTHVQVGIRCVILSPPLCITRDELDLGLAAVGRALAELG